MERTEYGGRNMIFVNGRGHPRAANPHDCVVPPMPIIGACVLFLVFLSADGNFGAQVRVVKGLAFGHIPGAAFMRQYVNAILY